MRSTLLQQSLKSFGLLALASLTLGLTLAMPHGGQDLWQLPARIFWVILGAIVLSTPGLFVGLSFSSLAPELGTFIQALQKAARASAWVLLGLLPALAFVLIAAGTNGNDAFLVAAPLVFIAALLFVRSLSRSLLKGKVEEQKHSSQFKDISDSVPSESNNSNESDIESQSQKNDALSSSSGSQHTSAKLPPLVQKLVQNHASAWLVFFIWEAVFLGIGLVDYIHVFTKHF